MNGYSKNKNELTLVFDNHETVTLWNDIYGTHLQLGNEVLGDYPSVEKVEDYLYKIEIDKTDYDYTKKVFDKIKIGGCSEVRVGNFCGRNYDWYYDNQVSFVVHNLKSKDWFESWGVAQCGIVKSEMDAKKYNNAFKKIHYQLLDGINENGVYCGINVVPAGDYGYTTGTNPSKETLYQMCIPQFVLDNAKSARDAVNKLSKMNIVAVNWHGSALELHALICDKNSSYVVEFIRNKMYVLSDQEDEFASLPNNNAIITNFYLANWNGETKTVYNGYSKDEVKLTGLTNHANGLERYDTLKNGISSVETIDDMKNLMDSVKFTTAYQEDTDPFWYSELLLGSRTIYSGMDKFEGSKEKAIEMYQNRDRDSALTWQTVHSSVYDLQNKQFFVKCQEQNIEHKYGFGV